METIYDELLPSYDYNPSGWDSKSNYMGENCDNYYVIYSKNRDSEILTEVNFDLILKDLEALESKITNKMEYLVDEPWVDVHRHNHWACGWIEYIFVRKDSPTQLLDLCVDITKALADYPVYSDEAYSDRQYEAMHDYWSGMLLQDRVDMCKANGDSVFAARHESIPDGVFEDFRESEIFN